jgi:hypothetical protein
MELSSKEQNLQGTRGRQPPAPWRGTWWRHRGDAWAVVGIVGVVRTVAQR